VARSILVCTDAFKGKQDGRVPMRRRLKWEVYTASFMPVFCTDVHLHRYRKHANSVRLFSLQSLRMAASAVCVWSYYEFCLVGLLFIGRAKSCYRLRIGLPCAGQGCMRKYIGAMYTKYKIMSIALPYTTIITVCSVYNS